MIHGCRFSFPPFTCGPGTSSVPEPGPRTWMDEGVRRPPSN